MINYKIVKVMIDASGFAKMMIHRVIKYYGRLNSIITD